MKPVSRYVLSRSAALAAVCVWSSGAYGQTLESFTVTPSTLLRSFETCAKAEAGLDAPAGSNVTVTLSAAPGTAARVSVPPTITIKTGEKVGVVDICQDGKPEVAALNTNNIPLSATRGSVTKTATLQLQPFGLSFVVSPQTSLGGEVIGTIKVGLAQPAGGGSYSVSERPMPRPVTITIATTGHKIGIPASITIPAGASSATVSIKVPPVTAPAMAEISLSTHGRTAGSQLHVKTVGISSLAFSQTDVTPGAAVAGTVTLDAPAPEGGYTVNLNGLNHNQQNKAQQFVSLPQNVTIAKGGTTGTFQVTALASVADYVGYNQMGPVRVRIDASASGTNTSRSVWLTLVPISVSSLTLSPATAGPGASVTGTVTIDRPAPPGGMQVNVSSSDASVLPVPAQLTIPAGQTSGTLQATTGGVSAPTQVTLTSSRWRSSKTATVTINPVSQSTMKPAAKYQAVPSSSAGAFKGGGLQMQKK